MRTTRLTRRLTATTAVGAALAAALVVTPARAGDDGVPFDTQILRSIMSGLGLQRGDEPQIDYHERAPLVLPPGKDLPPPQADASVRQPGLAEGSGHRARQGGGRTRAHAQRRRRDRSEQNQRMRPDQMAAGRAHQSRARRAPATRKTMSPARAIGACRPSELGYKGGLFSKHVRSATTRDIATLYRRAGRAPASPIRRRAIRRRRPTQPYGMGKDKYAPKASDYYRRRRGEAARNDACEPSASWSRDHLERRRRPAESPASQHRNRYRAAFSARSL